MPHIHDKPDQHDHVVSIYVFRTDFDEPKVMVHFHRKLHTYMQFGGHIELDEHPTKAIIHEIREEAGYDLSQLTLLQPRERLTSIPGVIVHPIPVVHETHSITDTHAHTALSYAIVTDQAPLYMPDEGESTDILLLSREEVENFPQEKIRENVRTILLYMFDHILKDWEPIPLDQFDH